MLSLIESYWGVFVFAILSDESNERDDETLV